MQKSKNGDKKKMIIKICAICQKAIQKKEDYAKIIDFHDNKQTTHAFIHTACWNSKFAIIKELEMQRLQSYVRDVLSSVSKNIKELK